MAESRAMPELKVRLDAHVAEAIRARSRVRGLSLEEEARRTLAESVALAREAFARRAAASRSRTRQTGAKPASDSTALIRRERDAWG